MLKLQYRLQGVAGTFILLAAAAAQAPQSPSPTQSTGPNPDTPSVPSAQAAPPVRGLGAVDLSGFLDGYYSYNANRPAGQINSLYNFDDETDQFNLEAAKLTLNHDPAPAGAHLDLIFGRTNTLIHAADSTLNYIEQAYIGIKPPKAHGFELDFGQFATSAGAEVIETMSNWNYSHGLLFTYAIPYFHFGLRSSMPVTRSWTAGVQLVNGWNDVTSKNGGVTVGLTSGLVKPKYTWNVNYYGGPSNSGLPPGYYGAQNGCRNLIDSTLLLTPTAKFNAYVNYDYGQDRIPSYQSPSGATARSMSPHWQGVALAARRQMTPHAALAGRYEYLSDNQGYATGYGYSGDLLTSAGYFGEAVDELTATYEYKWAAGLLVRAEYRVDWSNKDLFHYGNDVDYGGGAPTKSSQDTATVGLIAFFGPRR